MSVESKQVDHVLKAIGEEAFHLFVFKPPGSAADMLSRCQGLQEARKRRMQHSTVTSMHQDVLVLLSGNTFRQMIREVV